LCRSENARTLSENTLSTARRRGKQGFETRISPLATPVAVAGNKWKKTVAR